MGKLKGGILGPVTGKVGAVVGSVSGGQNIVKQMPSQYNDKGSETQLAHRSTFAHTLRWGQALKAAINIGFVEKPAKRSSFNEFMSVNCGVGVVTGTPVWNNLKIAKGSLVAPAIEMNTTALESTLAFTWTDDSDGSNKMTTDKIFAVAINPATKQVFVSPTPVDRDAETLTLTLPAAFQGIPLQTYCFAKKADGKKSSGTVRTGLGISGSELAGSVQ